MMAMGDKGTEKQGKRLKRAAKAVKPAAERKQYKMKAFAPKKPTPRGG